MGEQQQHVGMQVDSAKAAEAIEQLGIPLESVLDLVGRYGVAAIEAMVVIAEHAWGAQEERGGQEEEQQAPPPKEQPRQQARPPQPEPPQPPSPGRGTRRTGVGR